MYLAYTLAHYFFPRHSNNHKAKLLHASTLYFLILSLVIYQVLLQALPLTGLKILGYAANIPPDKVIELTNQKRNDAGVGNLVYNPLLSSAARAKGEHMLTQDYWAHVAPDGTQPWKFFTDVGYVYRYAGENLARDFSDPTSTVDAWMASPSHKENLLSAKYKDIGVAVVEEHLVPHLHLPHVVSGLIVPDPVPMAGRVLRLHQVCKAEGRRLGFHQPV